MVLPLLDDLELDFDGRTFTADAMLTQRKLADRLRERGAHFVFTAKGNQPTLLDDIRLFFADAASPTSANPPPSSTAASKAAPSGPPAGSTAT